MSPEDFDSLEQGTKLMTAESFTNGSDADLEHLLDSIVTFERFEEHEWVYIEESPYPFHWDEIVYVVGAECIDDENVPYEMGDLASLIGGD